MSERTPDNMSENELPVDEKGRKIIGKPSDTDRFRVGDTVIVYIHMRDDIFMQYPFGEIGVVLSLTYSDAEFVFNMPVVKLPTEMRMYNPDHLIVMQTVDGRPNEQELLDKMEAAIAKRRAAQEADQT